jgi:arylamine N-acetyltransferase
MESLSETTLAGESKLSCLNSLLICGCRRHVVNIVILVDGSKYMLDVGFGGDGPIQPLPLIHERVTQNIGSQQLRLLHGFIPAQTTGADESKKLWIYQYRNGDDRQWNSFYAFPEIQFFPQDLAMLNFYISRSPESLQTNRVLIVKFLRRNHQLDCSPLAIIYGKVMLVNGDVKLNTGGRTAVVKSCKTEDERVEALKEYFGITLTNEERQSINGTPTALGQLYFIS